MPPEAPLLCWDLCTSYGREGENPQVLLCSDEREHVLFLGFFDSFGQRTLVRFRFSKK